LAYVSDTKHTDVALDLYSLDTQCQSWSGHMVLWEDLWSYSVSKSECQTVL